MWRGPCLEDALKYFDESGSEQCSGFKWLNDGKERGKTQSQISAANSKRKQRLWLPVGAVDGKS